MGLYRAQEFAKLAGVTVRTLHHYDRLGLLKPSGRSESGYRLYSNRDLLRLEQILMLKLLGLPLTDIGKLLCGRQLDFLTTLRLQKRALIERRRQLEVALATIEQAESELQPGDEPDWAVLKNIIEVIQMQKDTEWMMQYYDAEARAKVEERKALWTPELQEQVSRQWADLIRDVEASLDEDPASPKAQALGARWADLVRGFTGGDPGVQAGLNRMYKDQGNWPGSMKMPFRQEVYEFIVKVMEARQLN